MTQSTRNSCHYSIYSVRGVVSVKIQCSIDYVSRKLKYDKFKLIPLSV